MDARMFLDPRVQNPRQVYLLDPYGQKKGSLLDSGSTKKYINIPSGKYIYVHKYVYICVYTYLCKMDEYRYNAGLS